ncbi:MAG: nicotinamide-nucleotide adenylyltransferase [Nitrososphaerota archaeon]|nr:nicotinamide-nucleotide adenylyltransferase [Nitrososphaerota archaeon]
MPKKAVGLFVGRFQPFHSGHLAAVEHALKEVNYLYIVVGSAQKSHERDNPFTAGERIMMIKAALDEAGVDARRWMLIPVQDADSHSVWVATLRSTVPKFDKVFSNDTLTIRLLKEEGIDVEPIPYLNRQEYSATNVRTRILERRDWEKLVPPAVARLVKELDGVGRVQSMITKDQEAR